MVGNNVDCNLCERPFTNLAELRKHTIKCITEQNCEGIVKVEKLSELQLVSDKEQDFIVSNISYSEKEEREDIENYHAMGDHKDVLENNDLLKDEDEGREIVFCNFCDEPFPSMAVMIEHTIKCIQEENIRRVQSDNILFDVASELVNGDNKFEFSFVAYSNIEEAIKDDIGELLIEDDTEMEPLETQCPICSKIYLKSHQLLKHLRNKHTNEESVCHLCQKSFENRTSLQRHIRSVHSISDYPCEQCNKHFKTKNLRYKHMQNVHTLDSVSCDICGKNYKNNYLLGKHSRRYHTSSRKDNTESIEEANYMRRMQERGNANGVCDLCEKRFENRTYLQRHIKYVHSTLDFPCEQCDKHFKSKNLRNIHIQNVHTIDFVSCDTCGKNYKNKNLLRKHEHRYHTSSRKENITSVQEVNYMRRLREKGNGTCDLCSKIFEKRIYLQKHIRTVHRVLGTLYSCQNCNKEFKTKWLRNSHISKVHLINYIACDQCGKQYKNKNSLGAHVCNHTKSNSTM